MARTRWFQQMTEIGLLPPAVDLTRIMEEVEFEPPSQADARGYNTSTNLPRPLADVERGPPTTTQLELSTSVLDSTLRVFLDDDDVGAPAAAGDLPIEAHDWHDNEDEGNPATYEIETAPRSSSAAESMPSTRRKRKRTIEAEPHSQSPALDAAAPLFAPSANSKRSRSNGTLVPAYPCARCIEKDIASKCRICYVGGACNACRARGRKCDLVDPETKHTHTGSITKSLLIRHGGRTSSTIALVSLKAAHAGGKNSKGTAGKLKQ